MRVLDPAPASFGQNSLDMHSLHLQCSRCYCYQGQCGEMFGEGGGLDQAEQGFHCHLHIDDLGTDET